MYDLMESESGENALICPNFAAIALDSVAVLAIAVGIDILVANVISFLS